MLMSRVFNAILNFYEWKTKNQINAKISCYKNFIERLLILILFDKLQKLNYHNESERTQ